MSEDSVGVAKDRFTSLDTLALVRELRSIGRAFVDKSFDAPGNGVAIALRSPTAGRRELRLVPGRYAALVPERGSHPEEPSPIARELRRLLSGGSIADVPDPAGERYLEVVLRRADTPDPLTLAVELFGSGNLLVARGSKLVAVAHPKTWAHRSVRVGADYVRPPTRGSPWTKTVAELEAALSQSRTDLASTLAARLSLGGPIAEELLARAELAGSVPAPTESTRAAERIHRGLGELVAELGDAPRGYLYFRGEAAIDVEPFRSVRWLQDASIRVEELPTFSEAVERYFSTNLAPVVVVAPDPGIAQRAELERQRDRQVAAIGQMTAEADRLTSLAEAIYANYEAAEACRQEAQKAGKSGSVELRVGDQRIPLLIAEPLDASARAIYAEAKVLQRKLRGAREALSESERRLAEPVVVRLPAPTAAEVRAQKPLWFERYRWFVSSEGLLVVGGRDAATNDLLVRRYLRPKDRYVHADVHGAPSVIVKHPESGEIEPTQITMTEAGQFSVAFSKAWRAGLASASAFWVLPDQVSKTGASGEFVARGAWVIHGTKNVLSDLPTELGIGTVEVQGRTLWCAAPPSALRARGRPRFLVSPGEERERPALEVELASSLGLSRSRVQSLLPAGGIAVRPA